MAPFRLIWTILAAALAAALLAALAWPPILWTLLLLGPLASVALHDTMQRRHAVLRNFPVVGHFRYLLESIRPEIQQYFVESDTDGRPFSREIRSLVYQRAKGVLDTRPFGTLHDLGAPQTDLIAHSIRAKAPPAEEPRIRIGEGRCAKPYDASLYNVSAMSFGSLSGAAVRALNGGAARGGFYHNTGEGGISPYHLEPGGDLVWQIGTGYFGCRTDDGRFDADKFAAKATLDAVKMIEIKLSQGAKPGHGGILPGQKVTPEIAAIRHVKVGETVYSPPAHTAFTTPRELCAFVTHLRELSSGKPIGIKLCVGHVREFMSLCKAMRDTGELLDYIAVDGAEGGTGAAPLEFSNSIGAPLSEGLRVVHNVLVGTGLRDRIKVIASGRIATGFHIVQHLAIGADLCAAARPMMFALGCIQALRCNSNHCPVGIATQDPGLVRGLDVADKATRVHRFHHATVHAALEILGAAGLDHPDQLRPEHIWRRVSPTHVATYAEIYDYLQPDDLLHGRYGLRESEYDELFRREWQAASADAF